MFNTHSQLSKQNYDTVVMNYKVLHLPNGRLAQSVALELGSIWHFCQNLVINKVHTVCSIYSTYELREVFCSAYLHSADFLSYRCCLQTSAVDDIICGLS